MGDLLNPAGKKSIILYIVSNETAPHFVIRNAFQHHFHLCYDFDWINVAGQLGLDGMFRNFIGVLAAYRPDYCFMQVQNPGAMDVNAIREMAKYTKIIHWSGDVRNSPGWYNWIEAIGREVHLSLFTNETDTEKMGKLGVKADFLQVGFDNIYYKRRCRINGWPDIVFVANDYDMFPLSSYRAETVLTLYKKFPNQFRVFGNGWERWGITTQSLDHGLEAECYNSCKLAISVSSFFYRRYYSDRLLRIMGSGGCAVSHNFPELEKDFTPGHNIITFSDQADLIEKCRYYLYHAGERDKIADNALATAHSKCTWDVRCHELLELLNQYQ